MRQILVLVCAMKDFRPEGYGLNHEDLPKSKSDAEKLGVAYFFTGKPCVRGHVAARYTKGGSCSLCTRLASAKKTGRDPASVGRYARANHKRALAAQTGARTYVPASPCKNGHSLRFVRSNNCVQCDADAQARIKEQKKNSRVEKLYGLSPQAHEALFLEQEKACRICGWEAENRRQLHVDHCHKSNVVRGLLCSRCNQALGLFEDNPHMIRRAADYVEADTAAIPRKIP